MTKFKGDIIITDPCYIDRKIPSENPERPWDRRFLWDSRSFNIFTGGGLYKHGFTSYIWDSTLYGDWSCSTFLLKDSGTHKLIAEIGNSDVGECIGRFCADAGLVGVFLLDEVLKFNPDFDYHLTKDWTTTWIKDFDGQVEYLVGNKEDVHIKGIGNINFITSQTGF
jgi:hypothetical protein